MRSPEEARLERLFRGLLLLSAAASASGCGSSGAAAKDAGLHDATAPGDGNAADASQVGDESVPDDGGGIADDATVTDADDAAAEATGSAYGYDDAACDPVFLSGSKCVAMKSLPCGLPADSAVEKCYLLIAQCKMLCHPSPASNCGIAECLNSEAGTMPDATALTLECATGAFGCGVVGRRPEGLVDKAPLRQAGRVGAFLADMARLEAASVFAFRRLRDELSSMRAPKRLVRKAERSARDEVRHARVTSRLARRRGAVPAPAVAPTRAARSIEAFATENAVEGCVREAFGALVATRQASLARDPEVRREMSAIARDETRHAALAWEVARWTDLRLDTEARARVRRAMRDAVESLRDEAALTPADVAGELGLPTGAEARALVDALGAALLGRATGDDGLGGQRLAI